MAITQKVTLYQQKFGSAPTVHAVEGDSGRVLLMVLGDIDSVSGSTAQLAFRRSDDTYYAVACTIDTANNGFSANIEQALTQPGTTIAQLKVTASSAVVSTYTFFIEVQKDVGGVATEQEVISVEAAIQDVEAALERISNFSAIASTLPAGSSATATFDEATGVFTFGIPQGLKGDKGDTGEVSEEELAQTLEDYARIDGAYEQMTVGNAEQLVSTVGITDEVPYNFRTSGGTADIGDREEDKIVGGTVAWNQLAYNGDFSNGADGWGEPQIDYRNIVIENGKAKISPTSDRTYIQFVTNSIAYTKASVNKDRKYLMIAELESNISLTQIDFALNANWTNIGYVRKNPNNSKVSLKGIVNAIGNTANNFRLTITISGTFVGGSSYCYADNIMCIDLTQMFGSTIADYIYSLEQANAGAGVALFKKLFPKPYYEYNPGELLSVNTSAHNTVGFNQWDEEWEAGTYYLDTGLPQTSVTYFRTKNPIHVIPNTTYHVYCGTSYSVSALFIFRYDANDNYLGYNSYSTLTNYNITIPSDCHYIRFVDIRRNTYNPSIQPICINLSWSGYRNGEYEPYVKHEYPLDSSLTLRGIPELDSANNLYYDGDTYEADGTVTRKTFLLKASDPNTYQSVSAVGQTESGVYYVDIYLFTEHRTVNNVPSIIIGGYTFVATSVPGASGYVKRYTSTYTIYDNAFEGMSIQQVKTYLTQKGFSALYLLPQSVYTTETAEPYQGVQIVNDFGTEEYVDYAEAQGTRDVAIPVGHSTFYPANLRDKVQHLPDLASADGDYIVRQTNSQMVLVPYADVHELPDPPTEDGNYTIGLTVTNGTPTYSWVSV